jgi:YhcH/YjgK/YiaL family protein
MVWLFLCLVLSQLRHDATQYLQGRMLKGKIMIVTDLRNADIYAAIHPNIAQGIAYLRSDAWHEKAPGRYEVDGDNVYAMIQEYETIRMEEGRWEAHQVYTDIQYIVQGSELMGCGDIQTFVPRTTYDAAIDAQFFEGYANYVEIRAGMFAVFFPADVHMPKIQVAMPQAVKKIVLKVRTGR